MKIILKILLWITGICAAVFMALTLYIFFNKQYFIDQFTALLSKQLQTNVSIGNLSFSFIHAFPSAGITLEEVMLTDSLFNLHGKPLLKASKLYISCSIPLLLKKQLTLNELKI